MSFLSWLLRGVPSEDHQLNIRCEKYIEAGLAAIAAGGCSGHWMVCCRCAHEWKERLEPDSYNGRNWYYCPRCAVLELGSRILAEYVERLTTPAPQAPKPNPQDPHD